MRTGKKLERATGAHWKVLFWLCVPLSLALGIWGGYLLRPVSPEDLQANLTGAENELQATVEELKGTEAKLQATQKQVEASTKDLKAAEAELGTLRPKYRTSQDTVAGLRKMLRHSQEAVASLNQQLGPKTKRNNIPRGLVLDYYPVLFRRAGSEGTEEVVIALQEWAPIRGKPRYRILGRGIAGTIQNASERPFFDVSIYFNVYEGDGNRIGSAGDLISDIEPGETWKFTATVREDAAKDFRFKLISAHR